MRDDEIRHGEMAQDAGAADLPPPVRTLMRMVASVMKAVAYRL
jgi:ubiquinone biosynthesis monooxygenase Coq7